METKKITVLGVGNLLFTDEGFGVRMVEKLCMEYDFSENVSVIDGGVLGTGLLGAMTDADELIVIDAVKNQGEPGSFYIIRHEEIPSRIRAKNSLHQLDFLETLSLCHILGKVPKTVIFGVEPEDIETLGVSMTETVASRMDMVAERVLGEIAALGGSYKAKDQTNVPGNTVESN